jgi:alpha-1,2-mannosyltransferase
LKPQNPVESLNTVFFVSLAWVLWGLAAIIVSILVVVHPHNSNNICVLYASSSHNWWAGNDLYDLTLKDGFLYLPHFAIIYTPFAAMGNLLGGDAWRVSGLAFLCIGLWRLAKLLSPKNAALVFAFGSFAAIAPTMASFRCGQANIYIAALLVNIPVELARRRWSLATLLLLLAVAVKPINFVPLLLAAAIYPPMLKRLALGLVVFFLIPFATQNTQYVWEQYLICFSKLHMAELPDRSFCDLRGIFWRFYLIPQGILTVIQIIAAAATLALCFLASRWWREPARSVFVAAFGASYLMLFNPRTESGSYVILSAILVIPAAVLLLDDLRPNPGIMLIVIGFCFCCDFWAYHPTDPWLKPLTCVVFIAFLIAELFRPDSHRRRPAPFATGSPALGTAVGDLSRPFQAKVVET